MSISGIQGLPIEITVVGCYNLDDKEWISRQDPYVCLEYGSTKYRTKTCTDGGKNPTFQEKFVLPLIEGLREFIVVVWNSNTLTRDDFIGSARIQLHKVLTQGFDDAAWPLLSKSGRHSGEIRLILHYSSANQSKTKLAPVSAPQYGTPSSTMSQLLPHQQAHTTPYPSTNAPSPYAAYPHQPATYPQSPYPSMAPAPPAGYPPLSHTYPQSGYPPLSHTYPQSAYPQPHPHQASNYYTSAGPPSGSYPPPSGSYPPPTGSYPPPPY